jgi:hypothetical protein
MRAGWVQLCQWPSCRLHPGLAHSQHTQISTAERTKQTLPPTHKHRSNQNKCATNHRLMRNQCLVVVVRGEQGASQHSRQGDRSEKRVSLYNGYEPCNTQQQVPRNFKGNPILATASGKC